MAGDESPGWNALDEWKEIRSMVSSYDGYLDSLRRYGFTFLAILLAASTIHDFLDLNKFTRALIILMIVFFTLGLYFFDRYYQQYIKTSIIRQRILETVLNFEIGVTLAERYKTENLKHCIKNLYLIFIVIEAFVGFATLTATNASDITNNVTVTGTIAPNAINFYLSYSFIFGFLFFIIIVVIGWVFLNKMSSDDFFHIDLKKGAPNKEDWIIDKLSCKQGDKVRITIINLSKEKKITFVKDDKVCDILPQNKGVCCTESHGQRVCESKLQEDNTEELKRTIYANDRIEIPPHGIYSWLWDTTNVLREGIYEIKPRERDYSLRRSVFVHKRTESDEQQPSNTGNLIEELKSKIDFS